MRLSSRFKNPNTTASSSPRVPPSSLPSHLVAPAALLPLVVLPLPVVPLRRPPPRRLRRRRRSPTTTWVSVFSIKRIALRNVQNLCQGSGTLLRLESASMRHGVLEGTGLLHKRQSIISGRHLRSWVTNKDLVHAPNSAVLTLREM